MPGHATITSLARDCRRVYLVDKKGIEPSHEPCKGPSPPWYMLAHFVLCPAEAGQVTGLGSQPEFSLSIEWR